ncbi:hypothetical protein J4211_02515 [Candidatus Woesearchaeota archaeon]|nr:hypothetical protein [Candidatus Woesearchaeota archaeon]
MKKRIVLFLLLLVASAFADVPYDSTYLPANTSQNTVYSDFPLDNIHILRLQEASMALGKNVSVLHDELANYQEHQSNQISGMQASIDSLQRSLQTQVRSLQSTVQQLEVPAPLVVEPNPTPLHLLLLSNLILFGIVIVLLIAVHRKPLPEDHLNPAPSELVQYIRASRKTTHDLRMELVAKGWTPSLIENAMKVAKR